MVSFVMTVLFFNEFGILKMLVVHIDDSPRISCRGRETGTLTQNTVTIESKLPWARHQSNSGSMYARFFFHANSSIPCCSLFFSPLVLRVVSGKAGALLGFNFR